MVFYHNQKKINTSKPRLFYMDYDEDVKKFKKLIKGKGIRIIDHYKDLLFEYFVIKNPHLISSSNLSNLFNNFLLKYKKKNKDLDYFGVWVFYPWNNELVHCLPEDEYYMIRTARNRNLVTSKEQEKLRDFTIGIIGLSVGQASALTLAISGMCNCMKLADPDVIEASNLNRIHGGLNVVGLYKTEYIARRIYELNPFAKLKVYPESITEKNLNTFLMEDYKVNAIIDAFDDVKMKIKLRMVAKEKRIPVLMATDLGDGVIIDIERYDINKDTPIFNGRLHENEIQKLPDKMKYKDIAQIAMRMIGKENIPKLMIESLQLVGKEISGHPQLGLASFLGGSIMSYAIKQICLGKEMKSERLYIQFEKLL